MADPRGIRNNNPGNIEDGSFAQGLPGYTGTDGRFATFQTPEHGMNAMDTLLDGYGRKGINSVSGVINRWAPSSDGNNTGNYSQYVASGMGVKPDDTIDLKDPAVRRSVSQRIAQFETGRKMPSPMNSAMTELAPATVKTPATVMQQAMSPGNGALFPGDPDQADWGKALQSASAWLASINDPKGGAALLSAVNTPTPKDRYSMSYNPKTGTYTRIDSANGQMHQIIDPKFDPNQEAKEAYDTKNATTHAEVNDKMAQAAIGIDDQLATIHKARDLLMNPDVKQGMGGEYIHELKKFGNALGMDFKGVNEGDEARSVMNQLTLQARNWAGGMPGSLSDKDITFLKNLAPNLNNTPEANQEILKRYERAMGRAKDVEAIRQDYVKHNGRFDEGFYQHLHNYDARKAEEEAQAQSAAQPTAPPGPAPDPAPAGSAAPLGGPTLVPPGHPMAPQGPPPGGPGPAPVASATPPQGPVAPIPPQMLAGRAAPQGPQGPAQPVIPGALPPAAPAAPPRPVSPGAMMPIVPPSFAAPAVVAPHPEQKRKLPPGVRSITVE